MNRLGSKLPVRLQAAIGPERDHRPITAALLIHQQLTGAYPLSLDELAPGVLPALPTDPFADDHRFRYHSDAQSFDLASVGFDGRDDAGTEADTPTDAFEPGHDGTDFVLRHAP